MIHTIRVDVASVLKTVLILQTISSVAPLFESMCVGTGYHQFGKGAYMYGPQSIGWNRLYPINQRWTHVFWAAPAKLRTHHVDPDPTSFVARFIKQERPTNVDSVNGWLHLTISRINKFHYLAVWAVNEKNEVYGNFIYSHDIKPYCGPVVDLTLLKEAYIPCSAVPVNSATLPNTFIYADLDIYRSKNGDFIGAAVQSDISKRTNLIRLLWRSSSQSYCQRPEKFRFMVAVSPSEEWETVAAGNWDHVEAPKDSNMSGSAQWGHDIIGSDWIYPKYFGHPTRLDASSVLSCGDIVKTGMGWAQRVVPAPVMSQWHANQWLTSDPWSNSFVVKRSTCSANIPQYNGILQFNGRCQSSVDGIKYVYADPASRFLCTDDDSSLWAEKFQEKYENYVENYANRLTSDCDCLVNGANVRSAEDEWESPDESTESTYVIPEACLLIDKLETKEQNKGGICIYNKVGKLVYGVRQWHGVTSLGVTLIITPLSIFIVRYNKGEMVLREGKVPVKIWYIAHILLVFPAICMYSSGLATISRQVDVLGYSYSLAGKLHKILGIVAFAMIPFQCITGLFRPTNLTCRKIMIFMHWIGGVTLNLLETLLCAFSHQIPASPTSSKSLFSNEFGTIYSSTVSCLVLGWFAFSTCFHIFLTIRTKCQDRQMGMDSRSVFPIIIPLLSIADREDLGLGHQHKEDWFQRGALLIFTLVACIAFFVSVVSLYQALHEHLYYGFGEMSCTHRPNGALINDGTSETECSRGQ